MMAEARATAEIIPPAKAGALAKVDQQARELAARFVEVPGLLMTDGKSGSKVTADLALRVAELTLRFDLDPVLGHVMLYEGKPYLTIKAMVAWADSVPQYDGYEWRVLSRMEMDDLGKQDAEHGVEVLIHRKDRRYPTKEYGFASPQRPHRGNPVEKSFPLEMAHKRALYRGLDKAVPPNSRRRRLIDPDQSLEEQQYQARLEATPTHPDRPQGAEWREFYTRCNSAGISHHDAHERIKAKGFDLTWVDPTTGEERDSLMGFEGTVMDALVLVGLEQPKRYRGEITTDTTKGPADQQRRRRAIDKTNDEARETASERKAAEAKPGDAEPAAQAPAFVLQERIKAATGEKGADGLGAIEVGIEDAYGDEFITQKERTALRGQLSKKRESLNE